MFDPLSGEESEHDGLDGAHGAQRQPGDGRGEEPTNPKLVTLADILGRPGKDGGENEASEADSQAGALSDGSIESDLEDVFNVTLLPDEVRRWQTDEDREIERIRRLASHVREQPHLPSDFRDPTHEKPLFA